MNSESTSITNRIYKLFGGFLLISATYLPTTAQVVYPRPVSDSQISMTPNASVGIVISKVGNDYFRGSAAVARHEQLIYSCGHMIANNGVWASDLRFKLQWNSRTLPSLDQMQVVRGYARYTDYKGPVDNLAFSRDFIVGYSTQAFGSPVSVMADGASALLKSNTTKLILGYPATIDFTGAQGGAFQYFTGTFTNPMFSVYPTYLVVSNVSTGGGNSGGPVLVNSSTGYHLAGVLISGSKTAAGVYAVGMEAETMAKNALVAIESASPTQALPAGTSSDFINTKKISIPDNKTTYTRRDISVSGMQGTIRTASLGLSITTPDARQLDHFLRSPSGRIARFNVSSGSSVVNLNLRDFPLTSIYAGAPANGTWSYFVRDVKAGKLATFNSIKLGLTSL